MRRVAAAVEFSRNSHHLLGQPVNVHTDTKGNAMTASWAVLLSFDSLIAGVALGPLVSARHRWPMAVLFGLLDGVATLVGGAWLPHPTVEVAGLVPLLIAAFGLYLIAVSLWSHRRIGLPLPLATPLLLSIDNLIAGRPGGAAALTAGDVAAAALTSAAFALVGLWAGSFLAGVTGGRRERLAGAGLLVVAATALLT